MKMNNAGKTDDVGCIMTIRLRYDESKIVDKKDCTRFDQKKWTERQECRKMMTSDGRRMTKSDKMNRS